MNFGKLHRNFPHQPAHFQSTNMKTSFHQLVKRAGGLLLLAALMIMATGCMSFHGGPLSQVEASGKAPVSVVAKVHLEVRVQCDGRPFPGAAEKMVLDFHRQVAQPAMTNSGLFGAVQLLTPGTRCQPGEYVVRYEINNWGNKAVAGVSGFFCGLTLFALPGFATDHYTVQAEVLDWQGQRCWQAKYEDKMTTVIWIGFFPCLFVPPCYPLHVLKAEMNNLYQHSFQDMLAQKAFPTLSGALPETPPSNP